MSKRTESITQPDVDTLAKRHSTESPDRVKEIIDKLIMNRGEHPSKDKTQHQILTLRRAIKLLSENQRREVKGYLTQVATSRYEWIDRQYCKML